MRLHQHADSPARQRRAQHAVESNIGSPSVRVIEQILAGRHARGESLEAFFFRTQDGLEADLLLESGRQREVIKIQLTTAPASEDSVRPERVAALTKAARHLLMGRTRQPLVSRKRWSVDLTSYLRETGGGD